MNTTTTPQSEHSLNGSAHNLKIAIISSIIPKRCGIATFSRDLLEGIRSNVPGVEVIAVAAETADEHFDYELNVVATVHTDKRETYAAAATVINQAKPDVVLLQHEFGLYGGSFTKFERNGRMHSDPTGDYIFDLLDNLEMPFITTLHTVLPTPDEARRDVIHRIAEMSLKVVAMTQDSCDILVRDYDVDASKIVMIHHGVTLVEQIDTYVAKPRLGIDPDDAVLMISGLIGENKSIDVAIKALPAIITANPQAKLYVVGQTHPNIIAHKGEAYRESLIALADELGVSDHLVLVNKYLDLPELLEYLQTADIYLTLHKDPEQAASGTLAYALGAGLVAFSTPYRYAKEVLADGRGRLVDFDDAAGLAQAVNEVLGNTELYNDIRAKAYAIGRQMSWPLVGARYLDEIAAITT